MLTDLELLRGLAEPSPEPPEVRAGPLVASLDGIELRWIRLGATEVLHAIYPAIRDDAWGTLPVEIGSIEREIGDTSFDVRFEARSRQGPIDIVWGGRIQGTSAGTIVYTFEGRATRAFQYCRIGLNVLHPASAAGRAFRGEAPMRPGKRTPADPPRASTLHRRRLLRALPCRLEPCGRSGGRSRGADRLRGRPVRDGGPAQLE